MQSQSLHLINVPKATHCYSQSRQEERGSDTRDLPYLALLAASSASLSLSASSSWLSFSRHLFLSTARRLQH